MKIVRPLTITDAILTSSNIAETDYSQWAANTTYAAGDTVMETSPTATVTISIASPCVVTWTGHGRAANTPIVFTTTGALPTGLTAGVEYFLKTVDANTFKLATTSGGTAINTSGTQSGTQTATARVHTLYQSLVGSRATATMTIATPCVVTWTAHGYAAGDEISFTTTGALPTGLVVGTVYFVLAPTTNTFNLAATSGGAAIATTGTQSGVHTATATPNSGYNKQPAINTTQWLNADATNRWKAFDQSITSQASNTSTIAMTFATTGRNDSVVILNANAASLTVTQTDVTDGVVFNQTYNLVSDSGITDWYAWTFEPIIRITDFAVTGLFPYSNSTIAVTLTDTGNTVLLGGLVIGQSKTIGTTQYGAKVGIQSYSVKTQDTFGNYSILPRAFRKTADYAVWVQNTYIDALQNLLALYRDTAVVYLGSDTYGSLINYGFYKEFAIEISYPTVSICTLQLEGLT